MLANALPCFLEQERLPEFKQNKTTFVPTDSVGPGWWKKLSVKGSRTQMQQRALRQIHRENTVLHQLAD